MTDHLQALFNRASWSR